MKTQSAQPDVGVRCYRSAPADYDELKDEIKLCYLKSGSLSYMFNGRKISLEQGYLALFWAAIPHSLTDLPEGSELYEVSIPLFLFLEWRQPDAYVQQLLEGNCVICEPDASQKHFDLQRFTRWEQDLRLKSPLLFKALVLELQARMMRLYGDVAHTSNKLKSDSGLRQGHSKADKIVSFVARNYTKKLNSQVIGDALGISPNYAMNLFRESFGTSLARYITIRRLSRARHLLLTTDLKVTDIAVRSGFNSISRFNEIFLKTVGCSPSKYRSSPMN